MSISAIAGAASLLGGGYEPETYMIKFAEDGTREGTIPCGRSMTDEEKQELIKQGYEEVPAAEWQEYCNGKIRGKDGKPVDPPPYVPTVDEKLEALDEQYNRDKAELVNQYTDSVMHDDTETAEAIKQELIELDEQYDADYEAIINGEE